MPSPDNTTAEKAKVAAGQIGETYTLWQALKARGWVQTYDYVLAVLLVLSLVTLLFWRIFAAPTALNLIAVLLVDIFICNLWLISLVFRCSHFVLETQADINLMPESAARIVAGYYSGNGTAPKTRK